MDVQFHSRDAAATELRELAISRVRFALRRLSWRVPRAKVQLKDANGPRGGIDKICQLEFHTPGGPVVIASRSGDWRAALDLALQRAARVLVRALQRGRKPDRDSHRLQRGTGSRLDRQTDRWVQT